MKSSGTELPRSCSTWWSRAEREDEAERLRQRPALPRCPSSRPPRRPARRARYPRRGAPPPPGRPSRPTGPGRRSGSSPPCLRSSCPRPLTELLDHEIAQEPGGRPERTARNRASSRKQLRSRLPPPTDRRSVTAPSELHTGRLSASTDTTDQRLLLGRILGQAPARPRRQEASDRAKIGLAALAPCSSGEIPQARRPSYTTRVTRPSSRAASPGTVPSQPARCPTSEDGGRLPPRQACPARTR